MRAVLRRDALRGSTRQLTLATGACLCVLFVNGQGQAQQPLVPETFSFEIVPAERFGPIREATSRGVLSSLVPAGAILDAEIPIGEGVCTDGVRVFPDSSDEIEVAWQDAAQLRVSFVRTRRLGGRWRTTRGVAVGTLLTDLERLTGRVLTFSGFGWDYGGGTSWSEGDGDIGLRLDIDPADAPKATGPKAADVYGDRPVRSDHPLIRTLRIRVDEIIQSWGPHAGEKDCR